MSFNLKLIFEDKELVLRQYPLQYGGEFFFRKSIVAMAPNQHSATSALQVELNRLHHQELQRLYARYSRVIQNNIGDT